MKYIYVRLHGSSDEYTKVDSTESWVNDHKWYLSGRGYAQASIGGKTKNLHRLITKCPQNLVVDHINHDKLDNTSSNLRICTKQQNHFNSVTASNNKTGYKGVHWYSCKSRYRAQIKHDGKRIYIGLFKTAAEAGAAYNKKALELFGEYAYVG